MKSSVRHTMACDLQYLTTLARSGRLVGCPGRSRVRRVPDLSKTPKTDRLRHDAARPGSNDEVAFLGLDLNDKRV